jgi:hypothetical protein
MDSHLGNPGFLGKMEKNQVYNLPAELPKLGREPSMSINTSNDLRMPSFMKKESSFQPDLFRGDSFFPEQLLRNDSFGGLDNFPMTFGLMRNSSVNSEFEGNMKLEDTNVNYNRHLLNLPPLIGLNSEIEGQKINEHEMENKNKKATQGFKLTKSSLSHNSGQQGIFHKGGNIQQE